jgi:hypothetical protein
VQLHGHLQADSDPEGVAANLCAVWQ